jgi:hypothetical protein
MEDIFVVSLPPPPPFELAVFGGDFDIVVAVFVAVSVTDPNVDERLGLTGGGQRTFLPSSMSRSKTNPIAGPRYGA